jgi:hypothetical protein
MPTQLQQISGKEVRDPGTTTSTTTSTTTYSAPITTSTMVDPSIAQAAQQVNLQTVADKPASDPTFFDSNTGGSYTGGGGGGGALVEEEKMAYPEPTFWQKYKKIIIGLIILALIGGAYYFGKRKR